MVQRIIHQIYQLAVYLSFGSRLCTKEPWYEFKKVYGRTLVKIAFLFTVIFTIYTAVYKPYDPFAHLKDIRIEIFKKAEGNLNVENYAAILKKAEITDFLFWDLEIKNNAPFDKNYNMINDYGGYKAGEKVRYEESPIYPLSVNHDTDGIFSSLFVSYSTIYHWDKNRNKIVEDANDYANWFENAKLMTSQAIMNKRKAKLYSNIEAPVQFITINCWRELIEDYIKNKAFLIFIILVSAFIFGYEKSYKTDSIILVTEKRMKLIYTKILLCIIISVIGSLIEAALVLAVNLPGGYFPKLFSGRIQNLFVDSPLNMSMAQFCAMLIVIRILILIIVSSVTGFFVSLFKSIAAGALAGGFVIFIPLLPYSIQSLRVIELYKNIFKYSLLMLNHTTDLWSNYMPSSFFRIPFLHHEFLLFVWGLVSVLCFFGCVLLYKKRS